MRIPSSPALVSLKTHLLRPAWPEILRNVGALGRRWWCRRVAEFFVFSNLTFDSADQRAVASGRAQKRQE